MYKVYIQTDEQGRVTAVNSDAFIPEGELENWIEIDEGEGDKFHHAQGNYFDKPIMTERGVYRYKLANGKVKKRTAKELQADIDLIPPPPPTMEEEITALKEKLSVMESKTVNLDSLLVDVAEMKQKAKKEEIIVEEPIEISPIKKG